MSIDKTLWENWKGALRGRTRLFGVDKGREELTQFTMRDEEDTVWNLPIRHPRLYSVGCDIVGYSSRSLEGQLYLTTSLFVAMEVARDALRRLNWMSKTEPRAVLPTGDGALMVFGDLQSAFAFTMALNMLMEDLNRGPFGGIDEGVERAQPARILPCEVRYALAAGRVVEIEDITGRPNYIGEALVTCSRILSASKGAHFLVEESVMAELLQHGGINEVAADGDPWDWQQRLHAAKLQTRQVKSARFTFYNVFGFYRSDPFLGAVAGASERKTEAAAEFPNDGRLYAIGSHDVTSIPAS